MQQPRSQESGFVLLAVMLVLMSTVSLGALGLSRSLVELNAAQRLVDKQQAFEQAEAAVDDALATLTANPLLPLPYTPTTSALNAYALSSLGYRMYTIAGLGNGVARISASGIANANLSQTIEVIIELPATKPFQQALFGDAGMHVHQDVSFDSYDSTLGAYTPAPDTTNRTANADLRTNSEDTSAITLDQNVYVAGDVYVGPSGVPSVVITSSNGVVVDGQEAPAGSDLPLPPVQAPAGTICGSALVIPRNASSTIDLATSTCYTSITVEKDASLTITGDGQLTLGDSAKTDLSVNGTLTIAGHVTVVAQEVSIANTLALDPTAKVKLYATDSVFLKGVVNSSQDPKNFSVMYAGTADMTAGQDTSFYGTIYAPNATLHLNQSGDFYGAVVAKEVNFDQGGCFHFDTALSDITLDGSTGNPAPTIISWRQP